MEFQTKLCQPLLKISQKPLRICPVLKPGDKIIGVAHDDDVAAMPNGRCLPSAFGM
jgi:hypothetical protein